MFICVVCLLFILARLRQVQGSALTLLAAALVLMVIAGQFVAQESRAVYRLTALFDPERSMTNRTSGRWDLAVGGWHMFLDHPLGLGTGGFAKAWASLGHRERVSAFREGIEVQAHSGWIKVLAENGLPGILLFVGFVLSFAVLGWRRRSAGMFLPGLLVTLVLSVAFVPDEFQGKGFWLLAAGVMAVSGRAPFHTGLAAAVARRKKALGSRRAFPSSNA